MNEAERCDRMSLMHAGKVLASGTPQELVKQRGAASLEEAFISPVAGSGRPGAGNSVGASQCPDSA